MPKQKDPDILCQQSYDLGKKLIKEFNGPVNVGMNVWIYSGEKLRASVEWSVWLGAESKHIKGASWDELMHRIEAELQSLKAQKAINKLEE